MASNPLKHFGRVPKIYIKLPTNGKFYPEDQFQYSPNGEVPLKAMTATDELILNNPDALLNGDAIYQLLRSCTVNCKDVKLLTVPDVDAMLLGIQYASRGDKLKINCTCPKCKHLQDEEFSIRSILDATVTMNDTDIEPFLILEDGEVPLRINMRPQLYHDVTNANIVLYEQARLTQVLRTSNSISDEERRTRMEEAFKRIADFQKQTLLNSIESVDILTKEDGDYVVQERVSDRKFIMEFIDDMESDRSDAINGKLGRLNNDIGVPSNFPVICKNEACGHEYSVEVKFDQSNFSGNN